MTPTRLLVPTYRNMLRTLAGLLDTARRQMPDAADALLAERLAPDMLPLASQIRFAVFQAQDAVFRLRGEATPDWLLAIAADGHRAGEMPRSIAQEHARIDAALALLDALGDDALDAGADLPVAITLPDGIVFDMTGDEYVRDWALPQFHFQVVTAYAILRHRGIAIGKAEYVPHIFAYLRPGTMPAAA